MKRMKIVSFTKNGHALAQRVKAALPDTMVEIYARGQDVSLQNTTLSRFAQQAMVDTQGILFISSAGIAVRAIAPYLQSKLTDPAVWVMDEQGEFIIPLLSGHIGGANAFAECLAARLGATAVLTTATDVNGVFQVDSWATAQGLRIANPVHIRHISAALLAGESVGLFAEIPMHGALPPGLRQDDVCAQNIWLSPRGIPAHLLGHALHLVPRQLVLGIGCRRGKREEEIAAAVSQVLEQAGLSPMAVQAVASIDVKQDEVGLLRFANAQGVPTRFYTEDALRSVRGTFASSAFVQQTVGVDNVCERAAAANGGTVICPKTVLDGVTVAVAIEHMEVRF